MGLKKGVEFGSKKQQKKGLLCSLPKTKKCRKTNDLGGFLLGQISLKSILKRRGCYQHLP